jgi:hypothetical protein
MILLTSTSDVIRVVTSPAAAIDAHASWVDNQSGSVVPARANTNISTAGTTTIVPAPPAGTQRNVKYISVRNKDLLLACEITFQHVSDAGTVELYKEAVLPDGQIQFTDGHGFSGTGYVDDEIYAPLDSPAFTGDPTAPTPAVGDNDSSIATTAFVTAAVAAGGGGGAPPATAAPIMDGVAAVGVTTKYAREDHVHPSDTSRAPLASPIFTGNPTAPTPTAGDADTSIATTAFVATAVTNVAVPPAATASPLMDGTAAVGVTTKFAREDHVHPSDTAKEDKTNKGAANGYASLDAGAKVPATQLPSYVDDVLEFVNLAAFPATGTTGIIYVALDTGKIYRWSGSVYVEISPSPGSTDAVPEGSANLYFTTARAVTAAPVQSVAGRTGAVALTKTDVGLGNVDNTSDANKPISTATQAALDAKAPISSPTFTGDPKAPTPSPGDNDTSIATTAFVAAALAAGGGGVPLVGNGATVTASAPLIDVSQTWNAAGVAFAGSRLNITDTASAASSILVGYQINSVPVYQLRKDGRAFFYKTFIDAGNYAGLRVGWNATNGVYEVMATAVGSGAISTLAIGTESNHNLVIQTGGVVTRWVFQLDGHFFPFSTAVYDFGQDTKRVRKLYTAAGHVLGVRVVTAAGAITVSKTDDHVLIVNKATGAATTVNLFAAPETGADVIVKDGKGDAATNNITIVPAIGNIDGSLNYIINTNFGSVRLIYNGTIWNVVAKS